MNCRALPGETQSEVERRLKETIGPRIDLRVKIAMQSNPASPPTPELLNRVQGIVQSMWPGLPVVPIMETGATDGRTLRAAGIPTYGISQTFGDLDDIRAHGQDERIRTAYYYDGIEFGYRLLKELARPF